MKNIKGFTLVELTLVVLITGILATGFTYAYGVYIHRLKANVTHERFELISNSLSQYAQSSYRLPCPAFPTPIGNETYGSEPGSNGPGGILQFGNCFRNESLQSLYAANAGIIPWRTLGLREDDIKDGWGNYITYKPAPHLTVDMSNPDMQSAAVPHACRSTSWYDKDGNHIHPAKALFCCNALPTDAYLARYADSPSLDPNWTDNSISVSGSINTSELSANSVLSRSENVISSNAWIDRTNTGDVTNVHAGADTNYIRAQGHAVTLISHGGNGYLSFLFGADNMARKMGTAVSTAENSLTVISDDEKANVFANRALSGTIYHPKTTDNEIGGLYDFLSLKQGASDDIVSHYRADQVLAKAGTGASCLPPSGVFDRFDTCTPLQGNRYGDFTYLIDTSNSMNASAYGRDNFTKLDLVKDILAGTRYDSNGDGQLTDTDLRSNNGIIKAHAEAENKEPENERDNIGILGFNDVALGCNNGDLQADQLYFTTDQSGVSGALSAVENLFAQDSTPLLRRIKLLADTVCQDGPLANNCTRGNDENKAILLISDGADSCEQNRQDYETYDTVIEYLETNYPGLSVNIVDIYEDTADEEANSAFLKYFADNIDGFYARANNESELQGLIEQVSGIGQCQ